MQTRARDIPFQDNLGPSPASLHQSLELILTSQRFAVGTHKITIFHGFFDLLQLIPKVVHFRRGELTKQATVSLYDHST